MSPSLRRRALSCAGSESPCSQRNSGLVARNDTRTPGTKKATGPRWYAPAGLSVLPQASPRRGSTTDCDVVTTRQAPADLGVRFQLLLAFLLISSIRLRASARGRRGRIPKERAARKKRKREWQRRRNAPVAGGAVYDSRRYCRLGRGVQRCTPTMAAASPTERSSRRRCRRNCLVSGSPCSQRNSGLLGRKVTRTPGAKKAT